jgi:hypothetical protein
VAPSSRNAISLFLYFLRLFSVFLSQNNGADRYVRWCHARPKLQWLVRRCRGCNTTDKSIPISNLGYLCHLGIPRATIHLLDSDSDSVAWIAGETRVLVYRFSGAKMSRRVVPKQTRSGFQFQLPLLLLNPAISGPRNN